MNNLRNGFARPISAIGLRLTGMSDRCGPTDDAESIATICAAFDTGITLLDTGDFYGMGHNELLVREALHGRDRDEVRIGVSFGILREPSGGVIGVDTRPVAVKDSLGYTLRRLGTEYIDIYRPARLSPDVPVEETIGAIAELVDAGYVREIGLPTVDATTLRRASLVHPIADVRLEYPRVERGVDQAVLRTARELGAGITARSLLAPGLHESRSCVNCAGGPQPPRVGDDDLDGVANVVDILRQTARATGATAMQVGISWMLSHGPDVVALVDVMRREQLAEAVGALYVRLSKRDLARIAAVVGARPRPRPAVRVAPHQATGVPADRSHQRPRTMPLTARELEVLDLVTAGMTNRAVASSLGISERTAREHVARIMLKLRVESRVEAAVLATQWRGRQ